MDSRNLYSRLNNQRGVTAIIVAICLIMLVGFIALSIDVGHLFVARNELQNASDAGALSGAGNLYLNDGTAINTNANQFGYDAAVANSSEQVAVEVNWTGGNTGDVQRGHWSFGLGSLPRGFYPNASTATVDLWGVTTEELDENPNFINAVRVRARRQATPVTSFFARIFGYTSFQKTAEAVAYIGFAGTILPAEVDSPIAICKQALIETDGSYDCTTGRFINDAAGGQDEETGMWTSLDQGLDADGEPLSGEDPCAGGTNASEVKPLVNCNASGVNQKLLYLGKNMEVNNGQISSAFNDFYNCWNPAYLETFMPLTLPVIDCENDPTTCAPLVGAVVVYVAWITQQPNLMDLPARKDAFAGYGEWTAPATCAAAADPDQCVWDSFVGHYGLVGADDAPAAYHAKTIYLLKSCEDHIPEGVSGGENFGILAEIPVLVK
jgi:Flp pilus assembly protein TadG